MRILANVAFSEKGNMVKTVALVSLSSGILGEKYVKHEVDIGLKRLSALGLSVKLMPNAEKGIDYLKSHPQARADDLIQAFSDGEVDMILCSIGGDDTYRLLPYLFENDRLSKVINDKIFLGFSDSTVNHFMLNKLGLKTFYGQSFIADVCELEQDMLPYSKHYFKELIELGRISEIRPSEVWYEDRHDYSPSAVNTPRKVHKNTEGFSLIQGKSPFSGKIFGGCLETIYDMLDNTRYSDTVELCERYELFPSLDFWRGKILLLETSEEAHVPSEYQEMLLKLKDTGIFTVISGIICGKPIDEKYMNEYKKIITQVVDNKELPILWNVNIGHAAPRCIIPLGVECTVDADKQSIRFLE